MKKKTLALLADSFGIMLFSLLACFTVNEYRVTLLFALLLSLRFACVRLFSVSVFFFPYSFLRPCSPVFGVCFSRTSSLGLFVGVLSGIHPKKRESAFDYVWAVLWVSNMVRFIPMEHLMTYFQTRILSL